MPTAPRRRPPPRPPAPAPPPPQRRTTHDKPPTTEDTPRRRGADPKDRVVTYRGPTDPQDPTSIVIVPLENPRRDEHFPLGHPVDTTQSTAHRLAAMAGHTFHIEPARPEGDTHVRQ